MIIGQNIAFRADDDARAQAELFVILRVWTLAKEAPEERVVIELTCLRSCFLGRENIDHGRHCAASGFAVTALRWRRVRPCGFLHGYRLGFQMDAGRAAGHPLGFECRYNEPQRKGHGNGLRKQ